MPDFDLAAEKRLVVALCNDYAAWDYAAEIVSEVMFTGDVTRAAFAAIKDLVSRCKPVTPITVQDELVSSGAVVGSVVPDWLKGPGLSIQDVPTVAARIRKLWAKRELSRAVKDVAASIDDLEPSEAASRLSAAIQHAESKAAGGARQIGQIAIEYLSQIEHDAKNPGKRVYFDTGFKRFDQATGGLMAGELAVFAARPGNGKSSFVMAVAHNLASRGIPVGVFWLEDDAGDAVRRLMAREFKVSAYKFRSKPFDALKDVASADNYADRLALPIFIDDTHGLTVADICARMRRMRREHGCRVFILDHAGEVRLERGEGWGDRHDLAVGSVARRYRDCAKELQAVPILVSQMNRRVEHRDQNDVPRMSDLDGSGQVEQAARQIAFIQQLRDSKGDPTGKGIIHLVKSTGGLPGAIPLDWHGPTMTWHDPL